jgi:class 3 adenylate cyclase/tetratricopeptide (TPR) repeat protein
MASTGPELRHAVVVVASIDDAAARAARLDPEQLHEVLSRWRDRAKSLATACGGRLTADIGPRLTVVFGVPVAHGNDAERALHMAVALHEALRDLPLGCGGLLARVGAASGQVLAAFGEAGMTLTGAPVSVAAQVMDHAEPGQTLVSNRVCMALPGRLDTEFVVDLAVPGITELIKLWRVRRFLSADETAPQHAFVGRQGELLQLAGVADDCLRSGHGRVVVIRGDAGIGKSRLAERFVALAREHGLEAHRVLVLDFGAGSSGDPLRVLVRSLLGVASDTARQARDAVVARAVSQGQVDEDDAVFAYDLLEVPQPASQAAALAAMDATVRQRGVQRFVTTLATRKSAGKALLIVFEDVHWAEPALLECLAQLACATRANRLTLALTVRAEQDPLDSAWRAAASGAAFTTIDLGPLSDTEARQLAARYRSLDPALADSCIRRAEGNPLFLDQLLRNVATPGNGHAEDEALPGTLQSIVLARLDRLPHAERQALQAAAVLGQRFSPAALRHVMDDPGYSCERLVQHAMARPEGEDYLFMHALIHEAVYASLLKSRRLDLHRRAAGWYEGRDPALYAEHLDAANDPAAPQAYEAAARYEATHFRNERALRLVNRALRIVGDGVARQTLACLRGELTLDLGQPAESLAAFRQAVESAADDAQRARAWIGVAAAQRLLDRYEEALHALEQAERAASVRGEPDVLAQIESLRGNVHFPMGNLDACLAAHQRALLHADAAGSPLAAARALGGLGDAYYQQGRMLTARTHFERCVELARARGFIRIEGANLPMIGALDLYCNDVRGALTSCEEALRIARRIGDARIEILGCDVMVSAEQWIGDWVKAEAMGRRALAVAQRLGARRFEAELLARVGLAVGKQDRIVEAEPMLDAALALGHASGLRYSGPTILGFIARTTRDKDKQQRALQEGVAILAQGCVSHCYLDLHEAAIEVSLDAQRWDEAERYASELEAYIRREPFPWATFLVARARALAAAGRGAADDELVGQLRALRQQALDVGLLDALSRIDAALAGIGRAQR